MRHGRSAGLAAPFKPKDVQLFAIISAFDATYSAYSAFQSGIERYWTLVWLRQHSVNEIDATVMKDGLVRADTLPLVYRALGAESLPRGARVRTRIEATDLLTLDVHASVAARLHEALDADAEGAGEPIEENGDEPVEAAGPLTLAIGNEAVEQGDAEASTGDASATPIT